MGTASNVGMYPLPEPELCDKPFSQMELTFRIATLTRVARVVTLVIEMPLKSAIKVLVFIAVPNLDRIAPDLK
jgi:hypothetical protein